MITPRKHMNLDVSVIRVAAFVVREVARQRYVELEKVRQKMIRKFGDDVDLVFGSAINFLFLLDRIAYHPKNDSLEYRDE